MSIERVLELKAIGLKVLPTHIPRSPFRFECGVALGTCDIHPGVRFGMHSYMNDGFVRSGVVIGRYCSIGRNVTIGTGHHEMNGLSTSSFFHNTGAPSLRLVDPIKRIRVLIGHDVWIGDRVIIMSGCTIGNGAVIAAGAVVTKDVPSYAVFGGVPATFIKQRFDDVTIKRLLGLRWHEFDQERLKRLDTADLEKCIQDMESWPDSWRTEAKEKHFTI